MPHVKWFQSTHSLRSATSPTPCTRRASGVSIHALLAECDNRLERGNHTGRSFNPRTPCGVRPVYSPPWTGTSKVSIHALLAECDRRGGPWPEPSKSFNPRTPCGVRPWQIPRRKGGTMFQSTHSLRSATVRDANFRQHTTVSIHALLAECDGAKLYEWMGNTVSIHALLAECDCLHALMVASGKSFNPRTPCGVRLFGGDELQIVFAVSIHALLAECDNISTIIHERTTSFNPRTPCGVRPSDCEPVPGIDKFQSTHSLRSATLEELLPVHDHAVSIHALLAECD